MLTRTGIIDGAALIPEPTSFVLAGFGTAALRY